MTINKSATNVAESVPYNNLIPDVSEYEQGFQPKKPEKKPDYPFELKVHLWRLSEAQAFAQSINKRLSSDRKKFVYDGSAKVPSENSVFVENRENPITKRTSHLSRIEAKHWKNTLDFSQTAFVPYITFVVVFKSAEKLAEFAKRVKQVGIFIPLPLIMVYKQVLCQLLSSQALLMSIPVSYIILTRL